MTSTITPPSPASPTKEMRYAILPDRMPPISAEKMSAAQKQAAAEICAGPRGEITGPYWPMLRSPGLANPMQKVGEYVRYHCPLDKRINEMAALIAARSWTQQFMWEVHIPQAMTAGLKPTIVEAISEGRRPAEMAEDETILYDFLNECLTNKGVSDITYAEAADKFGESGVIDILGIVGYYTTLAMIMNVARTPLLKGGPLQLTPMPAQLGSVTG